METLQKEKGVKEDDEVLNVFNDKKVLYAEDEEGIRENISEILELFFDKVVSVADGEEAMEQISLNCFDVLIFDICMPKLDGLDAIKRVRKKDEKIPILILSAHTDREYLWRAVELKITKYLTKPYDKYTLTEALKKAAKELTQDRKIKLVNGCYYDSYKKSVYKNDEAIALTKSESRLLEYFIKRASQTVTFEEIFEYMWEFDTPTKEAVKSLIKDLRKKIDRDFLKNIYGIGYMLEFP